MMRILTIWLLAVACTAHQVHNHAAFHQKRHAAPELADSPIAPRAIPEDLTTTLHRTRTETATLFHTPSPLPFSDDDLPPWADKLVEKIIQRMDFACSSGARGWRGDFRPGDTGSTNTGQPDENPHPGWDPDSNPVNNDLCKGGSCEGDFSISIDGDSPPSPPDNPHDQDRGDIDQGSNWQLPPAHNPDHGGEAGRPAPDGQDWESPHDHHSRSTISRKHPSSTASRVQPSSSAKSSHSPSRSPYPLPTNDPWPNHVVTGYYGSGQATQYPLSSVPWKYLTHLCYAFAATTADFGLKFDRALFGEFTSEAHQNGVKPVLSIGGYGAGGRYFSQIVASNVSIARFVQNVKAVVDEFDLGGIDIDWEFVGHLANPDNFPDFQENPVTDAAGYLTLLQALRGALGPDIELSAAVPMSVFLHAADPNNPQALTEVDISPYVPYLDRVYLMGYDLWTDDDKTAGANAAVAVPAGKQAVPDQTYVADGIEAWGNAFPKEKLVFGVPFYGYGYKLSADSTPEVDGLYVPVTGKSRGDSGESADSTSGFWRWRNLKSQGVLVQNDNDGSYEAGEGWQTGWSEETQTPFVFSVADGREMNTSSTGGTSSYREIISYDDPHSLRVKRKYAKDQGLGGMMFWLASADTDDGELARVLA